MKKKIVSMAVMAAALLGLANGAQAQKTTKLFNGKDLSNWNFVVEKNAVPAEQVYSVKDGLIPENDGTFLWTLDREGSAEEAVGARQASHSLGNGLRRCLSMKPGQSM